MRAIRARGRTGWLKSSRSGVRAEAGSLEQVSVVPRHLPQLGEVGCQQLHRPATEARGRPERRRPGEEARPSPHGRQAGPVPGPEDERPQGLAATVLAPNGILRSTPSHAQGLSPTPPPRGSPAGEVRYGAQTVSGTRHRRPPGCREDGDPRIVRPSALAARPAGSGSRPMIAAHRSVRPVRRGGPGPPPARAGCCPPAPAPGVPRSLGAAGRPGRPCRGGGR